MIDDIDDVLNDFSDARRYQKLRALMSMNQEKTWKAVCSLAAVGCYMSFEDFDQYLDTIHENGHDPNSCPIVDDAYLG